MINTPTSNIFLKQSKDTLISFYKRLTDKSSTEISFQKVFEYIKLGYDYKPIIQKIRNESDKSKRDELKKKLPAITVSGMFGDSRKIENLKYHSGLIQLDFDEVKNIKKSVEQLQKDKYTFAVFLSPSNKGIKLIVRIPADQGTHIQCFLQLEKYYNEKFQLIADKQCKDISRLLFLSWDENLFVNDYSLVWQSSNDSDDSLFEAVLKNLEQKDSFVNGKRNEFIYKLACDCYKKKIPIDDANTEILRRFESEDFQEKEIKTTVQSAYNIKSQKKKTKSENNTSISTLQRAENYLRNKYDIRLNEVSGKIESKIKGEAVAFKELNENNIWRELEQNGSRLPLQTISILMGSDFVPKYNPFIDYFEHLQHWNESNEIDFIEKVCTYVTVKETERFKIQFKKMLVRCIACSLEDNVFNKQVFVLVGEGQNTGKSTFCRWLCPTALDNYITEHVNTDKDGLIILATNFIINMDELATPSKAELNSLKSFISKDKINVRLPYAKRSSVHPRRANFIGSTNSDEFLTDETGNVRWLCFEVTEKLNFNYKEEININDVWRQAYTLYKNGFAYQLTVEEIKENEVSNSKFQVDTLEAQLIKKYYAPSTKENGKFVDASDVLRHLTIHNLHLKSNPRNIGKAMKILGFGKDSKYDEERGFSTKGYYVKEIPIENI